MGPKFLNEMGLLTLLIVAKKWERKTSPEKWGVVVREVKGEVFQVFLLDSHNLKSPFAISALTTVQNVSTHQHSRVPQRPGRQFLCLRGSPAHSRPR